jgi:hypothetical protein
MILAIHTPVAYMLIIPLYVLHQINVPMLLVIPIKVAYLSMSLIDVTILINVMNSIVTLIVDVSTMLLTAMTTMLVPLILVKPTLVVLIPILRMNTLMLVLNLTAILLLEFIIHQ